MTDEISLHSTCGSPISPGQQYFNDILPSMRNIYSQNGTVLRLEAEFIAFVNLHLSETIETLNHAVQLAVWRDPLNFRQLELIMTPALIAQPPIFLLQLGFQGDKASVTQGGIVFRRVGPKGHVLLQSDLYPSCISIGIFGCSRNLTITSAPWYKRLKTIDMAQYVVQTQIDPLLDPDEDYTSIEMNDPCPDRK